MKALKSAILASFCVALVAGCNEHKTHEDPKTVEIKTSIPTKTPSTSDTTVSPTPLKR